MFTIAHDFITYSSVFIIIFFGKYRQKSALIVIIEVIEMSYESNRFRRTSSSPGETVL